MILEPVILQSALALGGFVITLTIGGPLAASLARVHEFRRTVNPDLDTVRSRPVHNAAFVPLDLGPDPMKWPSQVPSGEKAFRSQEWPSLSWDDDHFGSHWRDGRTVESNDLGFHAMAARRYDSTHDEDAVERNEALSLQRRQVAAAQQRERQAASDKRRQEVRSAPPQPRPASLKPNQRRPDQRAQRPEKRAKPPAASGGLARQPPSRDELEALIVDVGLAGTVQAIMERTGWDFRKAAHYLAQIRQGS